MRSFLLIFLLCSLSYADTWEVKKDYEGIVISTRPSDENRIDEFRAVAFIKASVTDIVALIEDVTQAPKWIKYCGTGTLIERIDAATTVTHTINVMPWPLTDRDSVVKNVRSELPDGSVRIDFSAYAGALSPLSDHVHIEKLRGFWLVESREDGAKITYQVLSDPGHIPAWMVNMGIVDQPFETIQNLRIMMAQGHQ